MRTGKSCKEWFNWFLMDTTFANYGTPLTFRSKTNVY